MGKLWERQISWYSHKKQESKKWCESHYVLLSPSIKLVLKVVQFQQAYFKCEDETAQSVTRCVNNKRMAQGHTLLYGT